MLKMILNIVTKSHVQVMGMRYNPFPWFVIMLTLKLFDVVESWVVVFIPWYPLIFFLILILASGAEIKKSK